MRRFLTLALFAVVSALAFGSGADIEVFSNATGPVMRAWPTGPSVINEADPLGDAAIAMFLPRGAHDWYDMASGQYAVRSNSWTVSTGGATGGSFKLTFGAQQTGAITSGASLPTAATVKTALAALSGVYGLVGVTGANGGPFTIGLSPTVGRNNTLTADFTALTGGTGGTITQDYGTNGIGPTSVGISGSGWRWGAAWAMDSYPGAVSSSTMKTLLTGKMFSTQPTNGWTDMWIVKPDNATNTATTYSGDADTFDEFNLYVNANAGNIKRYVCATRTGANASTSTNFPTSSFSDANWTQWVCIIRSVAANNALCWANFAADGSSTGLDHLVQQYNTTDVSLANSWTQAAGSGGKWIYLNGQGPQTGSINRLQSQLAYFAIWPHPITLDQAQRLFRDPWCFLVGHGS